MFGCITNNKTPTLYSYTCVIENVLREPGLQRETLWSLNSFTQEQYSCHTQRVCDMISVVGLYFKELISFALKLYLLVQVLDLHF